VLFLLFCKKNQSLFFFFSFFFSNKQQGEKKYKLFFFLPVLESLMNEAEISYGLDLASMEATEAAEASGIL